MDVHQLSIAYVPEQDRILARVNTKDGRELQFWFTRRLTLGVAPLLDRAVTEQVARGSDLPSARVAAMDDIARKVVAQFQKSEALTGADFATPYKASVAHMPLFDHPLLVTEVNVVSLGTGQLRLSCTEKLAGTAGSRSFQMALSEQLAQAFAHLLERAVVQSQWRNLPAGGLAAQLDPQPGPDKPGYLN